MLPVIVLSSMSKLGGRGGGAGGAVGDAAASSIRSTGGLTLRAIAPSKMIRRAPRDRQGSPSSWWGGHLRPSRRDPALDLWRGGRRGLSWPRGTRDRRPRRTYRLLHGPLVAHVGRPQAVGQEGVADAGG